MYPELPFYIYIQIDGHNYVCIPDTYSMKWNRAFSSQLAGNIIRLNFIDRGPGIRVYDASLLLQTWPPNSLPYKEAGITETWDQQLQTLENSYSQVATVLQFQDPFGRSPGPEADYGVFFTSYNLSISKYSSVETQQVYCVAQVELTEATQVVA